MQFRPDHFRFRFGKLAEKLIAQEFPEFFFLVGKSLPSISRLLHFLTTLSFSLFHLQNKSFCVVGRVGRAHYEISKNVNCSFKLAKYCFAKYANLWPSCPCWLCRVAKSLLLQQLPFSRRKKKRRKAFKVSCRITKFRFGGIITQNLQIFWSKINLARRTICRVHLL